MFKNLLRVLEMENKNWIKYISLLLLTVAGLFYLIQSRTVYKNPITISSKSFTESIILGELVATLLEKKWNQEVIRKFNLGGTQVVFEALKNDDIDVYAEYTGTGYVAILGLKSQNNPDKIYKRVKKDFLKKWNIEWSPSIGFNNTYALAVLNENPRFKGLTSISQISHLTNTLKYGAQHEFMQRSDGHAPFAKAYQFKFKPRNIFSLEAGLMYSALANKKIDLGIVYSTDGRIKANNLKLLRDDKNFFPPYYVSLLAKTKSLKRFPSLNRVFSEVEGLISEEEMIVLNNQVDRFRRSPKSVVLEFLQKKKLISYVKPATEKRGKGLLLYFIKNRDYLFRVLNEHLFLVFISLTLAISAALPLGVLMTRHMFLSKTVFPIINTIQTIPSLALLGFLIPILGIGNIPAIFAFFLYSLLPIIRNTYTGIRDIDQNYIEVARGIGLTRMQILRHIELPLAFPMIISGIRTATVIIVGMATLATLIGAGGLGDPIFRGISTLDNYLILLGAIPAALLGISLDQLVGQIEKLISKNKYWEFIRKDN